MPVQRPRKVNQKATPKNTPKPKKEVVAKQPVVDEENVDSKKRFFQIVDADGNTEGRFAGHKPKQAANKAFTSLLKKQTGGGKGPSGKIEFSIVECTRNSRHKTYNYVGERVELNNPMVVKIEGKEIEYKYNNVLKKNPAKPQNAGAKKAPAKKAPIKKAPVKKAPVKKAPAKKAPAKKAPVKKAPAKN